MTVVIGPHVKRTSTTIDNDGNEVKPHTREIINPVEKPYKPTPEELAGMAAAANRPIGKPSDALEPVNTGTAVTRVGASGDNEVQPAPVNPLAAMIKEQVNKAVQDALKQIDIAKMVSDALKDAFKTS